MFIRYILYISIFCMLPLFSYAAENKSADYGFASNQLTFKNAKGEVIRTFTIQELQELFPQKIYDTETPWSEGKKALYRGPRVKDILKDLKITVDKNFSFISYDHYSASISFEYIQKYDPIFAIEIGCSDDDYIKKACLKNQKFKSLSFAEKGPIRTIWPFDKFSPSSFPFLNPLWIYSVDTIRVAD